MTDPNHPQPHIPDATPTNAANEDRSLWSKHEVADPTPESGVIKSSALTAPAIQPLSPLERRIIGVLVEKQKTLNHYYPLSMNYLVIGCNQRDNRDPVIHVTEEEIQPVLDKLIAQGLVEAIHEGRTVRYRHKLYEKWTSDARELAVLAELLLRGAQHRGLLRARASRMDKIDTVQELDVLLESMAQRGLIVFLTQPRSRKTLVTHGFHTPEELAQLREHLPTEEEEPDTPLSISAGEPSASGAEATAGRASRGTLSRADIMAQLQSLAASVQQLQQRVAYLEARLGVESTTSPQH